MTSPAIFSHFAVRVVEGDELNFSFWTQVPENITLHIMSALFKFVKFWRDVRMHALSHFF